MFFGGANGFDFVAVLAFGVVVAELGDGVAPVGILDQIAVGVIAAVFFVAVGAGGAQVAGDFCDGQTATLRGEMIGAGCAETVLYRGGAVRVIGQLNPLNAAGVLGQNGFALGVVGPGGIAVAAFVGDAGEVVWIAGIFVVVGFAGAIGVVDIFQITAGIITIGPGSVGMIGDSGNPVGCVVIKLDKFTRVCVDTVQAVVGVIGQGLGIAACIRDGEQLSGAVVAFLCAVGIGEQPFWSIFGQGYVR